MNDTPKEDWKFMAPVSEKKVWFITASAKGLGASVARAALDAGYAVVATGRKPQTVVEALGEHENLLVLKLDITRPDDAEAAVAATLERFGRIDVLCNNAGVFFAGYFENTSMEQYHRQYDIDTYGTMHVTRAVLPVMRKQRSGMIITTTSAGGLLALDFCSVYAPSKFALEGWMEALRHDVEPFGIRTMISEPGFMRTKILGSGEIIWPDLDVPDYAERTRATIEQWKGMDGAQPGDPDKYAVGLIKATELGDPPFRFMGGADAIEMAETKAKWLTEDIAKCHALGCADMAFDD